MSLKLRARLIEASRRLRSNPTPAERHLWEHIREKKLAGFKFRRQHIIDRFIVDFYCPETRLIIEIDGPVHDNQLRYDKAREVYLSERGYQTLRFSNDRVFNSTDEVLDLIKSKLKSQSRKTPFPSGGEGQGMG